MHWTIVFITVDLNLCLSILDIQNTKMDEQFLIQNIGSAEVVQAQGKYKLEQSDLVDLIVSPSLMIMCKFW